MRETIRVQGLREIEAMLRAMPERAARNVMAGSLRAGARVVLEAARSNARRPGGQGTLARALVLARDRESRPGAPMYAIYTRRGKSYQAGMRQGRAGSKRTANTKSGDGFYGPWVEFGTSAHRIVSRRGGVMAMFFRGRTVFTRKVDHPGAKPVAYLGRAFSDNQARALQAIRQYASARAEKELTRP